MKSRYEILIVASIMGVSELVWFQLHADQQAATDEGVDFAKTLINDVQDLSTDSSAENVPGYGGLSFPETSYYDNQDLDGMQADAFSDIQTGAASDVSIYAYDRAVEPKLVFSPSDPIMVNSDTISTDAMANPDVLTVTSGSCDATEGTAPTISTETCTSWLTPTTQTCNNTLTVDVTWEDISSCPIATTFNQVQATINTSGIDDIVYARAYCNPGSGDNQVNIQVNASDGDPDDCTGWTGLTVSTDQLAEVYTGVKLRPQFDHSCTEVPTFIQGGCIDNNCDYTIAFHELITWSYSDGEDVCLGTPVNLAALGYTGSLSAYRNRGTGLYCAYKSKSVNLTFEKPNITSEPTVTDTWNDGCALYEAMVQ